MGSMKKSSEIYFFEDRPLFGLDIGHNTIRVMQLDLTHKMPRLKGYGSVAFDPAAIVDGVIVKPEIVSRAALHLFRKGLVGDISTNRVAVSLPANHAFTRAVRLPKIGPEDIAEAVQAEAEQYIPGHADNLYLDYMTLREDDEGIEVFIVAMSKAIIDSYMMLMHLLGLEAVLFDTSIGASARLFAHDSQSTVPSLLVDFGTGSTEITVFNHGIVVLGTVSFGGDDITKSISRKLGITPQEALVLKSRYGLSSSLVQKQVAAAVEPSLDLLIKEIRRTIRYYEQRYVKEPPIGQIVAMGGGANMPGLTDYLTDRLRLPTRSFDPAPYIEFGHLKHFYSADRASFVTAAGLAVAHPSEVFA
jgi:type IV pilus assembly protein PilM